MNLQQKTLQRYRQLFPNETLREISNRTGIQITRVFRLFNGRTMKVSELEAFEKAISDKIAENPSFARLNTIVEEASCILTNDEISKVAEYISRKVLALARRYGRLYVGLHNQSAIIA